MGETGHITDTISQIVHYSTITLEVAGMSVIMVGAVVSSAAFLWRLRGARFEDNFRRYRADLGRNILIALELLIAADILNSLVIDPSLNGLAVLAGIVAIRTFLSFSLDVEINGYWPWQSARATGGRGDRTDDEARI